MTWTLPSLDGPPRSKSRLTLLQAQLLADGADCANCPLGRAGAPGRPVPTAWDYRKGRPKLALVGEAPGVSECRRGQVFIGGSGKLLDQACRAGGVPRGDIAILNAGACGPIPSGDDVLKKKVLAACRPRLLTELRRLRPNTILSIGGLSLKTLAPDAPSGVTALRGAMLEIGADVPVAGWRPHFLGSLHPAHILRGGDGDAPGAPGAEGSRSVDLLYYFLVYDLAKAWRLANGRAKPWVDNCDLFLVHDGRLHRATTDDHGSPIVGDPADPSEFIAATTLLRDEAIERGQFSCDVETDAKDSLEANLTAIGFATTAGSLCASWDAWNLVPQALAAAHDLLSGKLLKYFWNRIYDCIVLPRHGLPVANPIGDGLIAHHAAFPGLPHRLDSVAQQMLVVLAWKTEYRKSTRNEPELLLYCSRDSAATALLPEPILNVVRAHKTERVYESDRQIVGIAQRMREFGFWVDRKEQERQSKIQHARLDYMRASLERDFAAIEGAWRDRLARNLAVTQRKNDPDGFMDRVRLRYAEIAKRDKKPTDVGLLKTKAKADLVALFEVLRIPFTSYTPKGSPVTDKKSMEAAAAKHPLMRQLIHIREAQHVLATYIDGLPIKRTGRVHPDWSVIKIVGRWSAGKSQNIPKQVAGWPPEEEPDPNYKPPTTTLSVIATSPPIELPPLEAPTVTTDEPLPLPLPLPIVVNIRDCPQGWETDPKYVYCGRPGKGLRSDYGNPHVVGKCPCGVKHSRAEAIAVFRGEAKARFDRDLTYRTHVEALRGKWCICFCAPKPCHCGVYVELLSPPPVAVPPAAPPPGPRPGFRWKRKRSGDYTVHTENARALISAPTVEEILAHAKVEPSVYEDPRYRPIYERALAGHGRILVGADFNQLHLRIVALFGKDKFLLDAYAKNADVHAINATTCFPKVFPQLVEDWKRISAGTAYAIGRPLEKDAKGKMQLTLKADLAKLDRCTDDGACVWCGNRLLGGTAADSDRAAAIVADHITGCLVRAQLNKTQKPWSSLRDLAKRLVYAWIYRGSPEAAYQSIVQVFPEVELSAIAEAFRLLDAGLPGWIAWCNRNEITVRLHREAREPLHGRVRLFPLGSYDPTIAVNFPVIGFETALMARSLFRLIALTEPSLLEPDKLYANGLLDPTWVAARRAEGYDRWNGLLVPIINGHDAIDCEVSDEDGPRAMKFLEMCMDHTITLDGATMRFFGEGLIGRRLSET